MMVAEGEERLLKHGLHSLSFLYSVIPFPISFCIHEALFDQTVRTPLFPGAHLMF